MPCYNPIPAYQHRRKLGRPIFALPPGFSSQKLGPYVPLQLPCGQCIGCRLERSRTWAARMMLEASLHSENSFVTLTYGNEHLPSDGSLHLQDMTRFIKRLRKEFPSRGIKYYYAGEYGTERHRPHYHICLFGLNFPDATLHSTRLGIPLYRSATLESLWPFGYSTCGELTFESAAYVARYICDKITGDAAKAHYDGRTPEFSHMSTRPAIGKEWFDKYHDDVYPQDSLIIRGDVRCRPPAYFDKLLGASDDVALANIKARRRVLADALSADNTPERLVVRERVKYRQIRDCWRVLDAIE